MIFIIVHWLFLIYTLMIMARLIASWFPSSYHWPIIQFLGRCTDPYLGLFRKIIPPIGVLDLSPILAIFALQLLEKLILLLL